ncbi:hypothetical protein CHARACLAT_011284 [Characodon lateralis]|uniref:Uncharacterized protein n=1 Tax=Characodon lateralis TaxID=208331 RepID=A0ABU7EIS4_9TELE|nr:hypothetical protein [Characodon lateralis]
MLCYNKVSSRIPPYLAPSIFPSTLTSFAVRPPQPDTATALFHIEPGWLGTGKKPLPHLTAESEEFSKPSSERSQRLIDSYKKRLPVITSTRISTCVHFFSIN